MRHALRSKDDRATYALRKQTVEPVFGRIQFVIVLTASFGYAVWIQRRAVPPLFETLLKSILTN